MHIRLFICETDDPKFCSWVLAKDDRNEEHSGINWPQIFQLGRVDYYLTTWSTFLLNEIHSSSSRSYKLKQGTFGAGAPSFMMGLCSH